MPRATYGPTVKARTIHVLKTLLRYANNELEDNGSATITCSWHDLDTGMSKLLVQTNLRTLHRLCQCSWTSGALSKADIREALRRLQDFLEILEDYRVHQRGTETWHFGLHLWCRETEDCVRQASEQWDKLREQRWHRSDGQKSKDADPQQSTVSMLSPSQNGLLPGAPFQALPLPHFFVNRPEPLADLKRHLLDKTFNQPGTLVVSAIYGLGGIGKTVLASALAHDLEVQSRFCDGVLWATLGQEPDILSFLSNWIQDLGDHSYKPTTSNAASAHLRTLLHDKQMLLVVDDVWNPTHAEPFRVGGTKCCVLVTTREAYISGALRYDLDVMTPEQAISLFQQAIQEELLETDIQEALALSKEVEYLPLALELAAAQIEDGASWTELLEALQQEIAQLEVLDIQGFGFESQEVRQRNLSLLASFNLSLRRLMPEQLSRFAWLGVVPEDVMLTELMAATLWETTPQQARTMLRFLKSRAMLLAGGRQPNGKLGYRMHDLMHAVACRLLVSEPEPHHSNQLPGLGLELKDAHAQFLARYRCQLENGLWHTLTSDSYIHAHLTWHLEQAGLTDEVHQLLQETTVSGVNGWYEACKDLEQTAGFVADVARGWRLAEDVFAENPARSLSLQFRYALIKASLNTLVENCPPELIKSLVEQGIWQPAQGLAHAKQSPNPVYQREILENIVPILPESLLPEALHIANNFTNSNFRAIALAHLACRMPSLRSDAILTIQKMTDNFLKALAMGRLASACPHLWPEVMVAIRSARTERDMAMLLRILETELHFPDRILDDAWSIAQSMTEHYNQVTALGTLVQRIPHLQQQVFETLLQPVQEIQEIYGRAYTLSILAVLQPDLWPEVMSTIKCIMHEQSRARVWTPLIDALPAQLLPEAIALARTIEKEPRRAIALGTLTTRQFDLWQEAVAATQVLRDADWQIRALAELAMVQPALWDCVQQVGKSFQYTYDRAIAKIHLARQDSTLWDDAVVTVREINDVYDRANAFRVMAQYGPQYWSEALAAAESVHHLHAKAELFYELAEVMPEAWPYALDATDDLWFDSQKSRLIYKYAMQMPSALLTKALEVVQSFQDPFEQLLALSGLSMQMPHIHSEVLALYQQTTFTENDQTYNLMILVALAVSGVVPWSKAWEAIASTQTEVYQATAIHWAANILPTEQLEQGLEISLKIQNDYYRAHTLQMLLTRINAIDVSDSVWCLILHTLASLKRYCLLEMVPLLIDGIVSRGGNEALEEVAYAIRDVCQQW